MENNKHELDKLTEEDMTRVSGGGLNCHRCGGFAYKKWYTKDCCDSCFKVLEERENKAFNETVKNDDVMKELLEEIKELRKTITKIKGGRF